MSIVVSKYIVVFVFFTKAIRVVHNGLLHLVTTVMHSYECSTGEGCFFNLVTVRQTVYVTLVSLSNTNLNTCMVSDGILIILCS